MFVSFSSCAATLCVIRWIRCKVKIFICCLHVNLRQHVALQSLCFLAVLEGFALSFYANANVGHLMKSMNRLWNWCSMCITLLREISYIIRDRKWVRNVQSNQRIWMKTTWVSSNCILVQETVKHDFIHTLPLNCMHNSVPYTNSWFNHPVIIFPDFKWEQ
jgi:hypothetical protein